MIRTGIADITPLLDSEVYKEYYGKVPEFRQEKADHIKDSRKRAQSIGAWILYEKMCERYKLSHVNIYNLSHSGDYVLCSVEDSGRKDIKLGCDIEEIKKLHLKLIERYFLENEKKYILEQTTEEEKKAAFYRYWVLKESFMKATRRGMGLGLDTFEIQIPQSGEPRLIGMPKSVEGAYYFKEYSLEIPYRICVCATERMFAEKLQKVEL